MSRAKNSIKSSDVSNAPILVRYSASYSSQSIFNCPSCSCQDSNAYTSNTSFGITANRGINEQQISGKLMSAEGLNYRVIRQLYYQNYITGSSFNQTSSFWDSNLQSTAITGATGSDYRIFPTASNSNISFLSIPSLQFGEQISRNTFKINSPNGLYSLVDDGNGNLVDSVNSNVHVGNILYAQGIINITNSDYVAVILDSNFSICVSIIPTPPPSPSPSTTPTITPTQTLTPSVTATITPTPTIGASTSPSLTPSLTPTVTFTPTITPSITPSLTPTISPTITPTITPSITPSLTPTVSPSLPATNLRVYIQDDALISQAQAVTIYATKSSDPLNPIIIWDTSIMPNNCAIRYTITGLSIGETVEFSTDLNCVMVGSDDTLCPGSGGSNITYTYQINTPGINFVGLSIDTFNIP